MTNGKQPLMIVRYGGYGDNILWSSVLPFLQERHDPIRLEVTQPGIELFLRDPRFDYVSIFDYRDAENEAEIVVRCTQRWEKIEEDCKKNGWRFLNFWGSLENTGVIHECNEDVHLTKVEREAKYNVNHYETIFKMAEVEMPKDWMHRNTFVFSKTELNSLERWKERNRDFFCVLAIVAGSSRQKVYPTWIQSFCNRLIDDFPKLKLYLMGGSEVAGDAWEYQGRVISCFGKTQYRQAMLMTKYADFVFGADTGLSIAAGMFGTPKSMLFTMTNAQQIVKYHENDYSIQSSAECSPCYILAHNGEVCPVEPVFNQFPICTHEFDKDKLYNTISMFYSKRF